MFRLAAHRDGTQNLIRETGILKIHRGRKGAGEGGMIKVGRE